MAIRVGRWDCEVCDTKGILGPETKCGNCGSPRPENVKFYLPDDAAEVTDEKKIEEAHAGADWVCSHCGSHNKHWATRCQSCGSPKDVAGDGDKHLEEKITYFNPQDRPQAPKQQIRSSRIAPPKQKRNMGKYVLWVALFVVGFIALTFISSDIEVQVKEHRWQRTVAMQEYKRVNEEGWSLPAEAQLIKSYRAVHHNDKRLIGHETKTRTKRVKVGEERYKCGTKDKGNGYFEDVYCTRPVYESREETYQEPVYELVPVYQTKYEYSIMRWKEIEPLVAKSTGKNVYWPEPASHQQNERFKQGERTEKYTLIITDHKGEDHEEQVSFQFWQDTPEGGKVMAEKSTIFGYYQGLKNK
ncbi:MAG: zinc finger Ran-binding domain-containing protein [Flammeovirgaceae bacterium]